MESSNLFLLLRKLNIASPISIFSCTYDEVIVVLLTVMAQFTLCHRFIEKKVFREVLSLFSSNNSSQLTLKMLFLIWKESRKGEKSSSIIQNGTHQKSTGTKITAGQERLWILNQQYSIINVKFILRGLSKAPE